MSPPEPSSIGEVAGRVPTSETSRRFRVRYAAGRVAQEMKSTTVEPYGRCCPSWVAFMT